jgi:hypothetical protein
MSQYPTLINPRQSIQELEHELLKANASRLHLITGAQRPLSGLLQHLIDHLALRGEVLVIVGGNRYSIEKLPFLLEGQGQQLHTVLERIRLTRAETPYQLLDALQNTLANSCPVVVTDILSTLYDEGIDDTEACRLLKACLRNVGRLAEDAPVLVSAANDPRRPKLFDQLQEMSAEWRHLALDPLSRPDPQATLF